MNEENNQDRTPPEQGAPAEGGTQPEHPKPAYRRASGSSPLIEGNMSMREKIQKGPAAVIVAVICIFVIALSVNIILTEMGRFYSPGQGAQLPEGLDPADALTLNLFYPLEGKVALEQRLVPKVTGVRDIAAVAVREFLSGPSGEGPSYVPDAVELVGIYLGQDGVLYLDFSSAMTLNFKGDAVAEFLLLRALYKTLKENASGVSGYRLLVDGREVDTIGGHVYVLSGLERAVPYKLLEEDEIPQ